MLIITQHTIGIYTECPPLHRVTTNTTSNHFCRNRKIKSGAVPFNEHIAYVSMAPLFHP